jgi:uncharacterized membrane-anchored protein YjiN (DUF445 family)|tara:strand:+ start:1937 stop:2227 length:291 start_codon:yes stop_codon:yes gene_type:complete
MAEDNKNEEMIQNLSEILEMISERTMMLAHVQMAIVDQLSKDKPEFMKVYVKAVLKNPKIKKDFMDFLENESEVKDNEVEKSIMLNFMDRLERDED